MSRYLGEFEHMVLAAVLRLADDAYGVRITDEIERVTGRTASSGALSVTLDRLEKKELIKSRLADPSERRGGRRRRYVSVTPLGSQAVSETREAMVRLWGGLDLPESP